ncbi:hypothetical protein SUGI_0934340 [Cryptomeria japonica]|nr:hypothetical protein SUGI_0934340 [Cryptomeria japonica]
MAEEESMFFRYLFVECTVISLISMRDKKLGIFIHRLIEDNGDHVANSCINVHSSLYLQISASSTTASYPFLQFDLCNTVDVWQIYSQISMQENAHKTIALSVHFRDMGFSRIRWNLLITHMP